MKGFIRTLGLRVINMQPIRHQYAARLDLGVEMCEKLVDERGKINTEMDFLMKHVSGEGCCVVMKNKARMLVLSSWFRMCRFILVGRNVHDEEYDPEHPAIKYRYSQRPSNTLATDLHRRYRKILYLGDDDLYSQEEILNTLRPHHALLHMPPCHTYLYQGDLYFPLFVSKMCGVVYIHASAPYHTCKPDLNILNQELTAFHLLTRGYSNCTYDERVELEVLGRIQCCFDLYKCPGVKQSLI